MNGPGIVIAAVVMISCLSWLVAQRMPARTWLRYVAGWGAIFALTFGLLLFRNELGAVWDRARDDLTGNRQSLSSGGETRVQMADDGHFWAQADIAGRTVPFLIDSGATTTMLSRSTARDIGLAVDWNGYPVMVNTANGTIRTYRAELAELGIGSIRTTGLPVLVSERDDINVLGMNWLTRLANWRVEGRTMILTPQGLGRDSDGQ